MAKKVSAQQTAWSDEDESSAKLWMLHQYTIARKAALEPAFRKQLLAKPGDALKATGMRVPKGAKIKVLVSSAKEIYVVLPPAPGVVDYPGVDLSEGDLKSGSGDAVAMAMDNFDIQRKKDPRMGNSDVGQDPKGDSDMTGDGHIYDHQK